VLKCAVGSLYVFLSKSVGLYGRPTMRHNSRIHAIKVLLTSKNTGIGACLLRFILKDVLEIIEGTSYFLNTVFANMGVNLCRFTALMTKKRLNVSQVRT